MATYTCRYCGGLLLSEKLDSCGCSAAATEELMARRSAAACSSSSAHDKAWEKGFIVPIAKAMKARGVAYMLITIRADGKAAYVLEPKEPECLKCAQNGWSAERNGPCPKFPNCAESFPENV